MHLESKIFVTISFLLTLVTAGIASFYVPGIETQSRNNREIIGQLRNSYFLETQRYGQNSLNLSAAAQIISSERILYITSKGKNDFTRKIILEQGRDALINGMKERKKAIENSVSTLNNTGEVLSIDIPPVPEKSTDKLFAIFENTQGISIEVLRENVRNISAISQKYDRAWEKVAQMTISKLTELNNINAKLDSQISFWMKIALILQILAMVLVFLKDRLSE